MQTPWSHLKRSLTVEEWTELRAWLETNPQNKTVSGTGRDDGRLFRRYSRQYAGGEIWETAQTRDKRLAHSKRWAALPESRERANAAKKLKYHSNPEYRKKANANSAEIQKRNRKRINARARERRLTDPVFKAKLAEANRKWVEKNRVFFNTQVKRRRALRKGNAHPFAIHYLIAGYYALARKLTQETGIRHEVDHIIPLCLGGFHHQDNMQVLPSSVNRSKLYNPFWLTETYLDWRDVPRRLWPDGLRENYTQRLGAKRWVRRFSALCIYGDNKPPKVEYAK